MTANANAWFDGALYWIECPEHGQQHAEPTTPGIARCVATYGAESFGEPARCEWSAQVRDAPTIERGPDPW